MYIPKYKITTEIMRNIATVEVAKEVVDNAPLVPVWEMKFREEAMVRAAHYGTAMEGNDLTLGEAKLIVEREIENIKKATDEGLVARERDVQEVINYRNVLEFIGRRQGRSGGVFEYTSELLFELHRLVAERVVSASDCGAYRTTQVVLRNSVTGEVGFRPPGPLEVPFLVDEFLRWLNGDYGRQEHPVIRAAIALYVLNAVHPFVEGNGRTARAFATMVMIEEGYDIKRLFALEEYFDKHADEYYGSLMEVSNQSHRLEDRDLTVWITTFTRALAIELNRVKERVRDLSVDIKMKQKMGTQVQLSQRQMKMVEYLNTNGQITMAEAREVLPMVSEDTILRDLKFLMQKGVVKKVGSTKAARYVLNK